MAYISGKDNVDDALFVFPSSGDTIDGKSGFDIVYGFDTAVNAQLVTTILVNDQPVLAGPGSANSSFHDTLISIEGIIGSNYKDTLVGSNSDNLLAGKSGNDFLNGLDGNDTLNGGEQDDFLIGGNGEDSLIGGGGNDTLTGGNQDDILDGGSGNDSLIGGGGFDQLSGGTGNDIYLINTVDNVNSIIEAVNEGSDTVKSIISTRLSDNLENLTLIGSESINGKGNTLNNTIEGNDANNNLDGGIGNDTLTGGAGADRFGFNSFTEGTDSITDFTPTNDIITIKASGFGGGLTPGTLSTDQFRVGEAAVDRIDRFIYNGAGALFFDADGAGSTFEPVQIATLTGTPTLSAANIVVI